MESESKKKAYVSEIINLAEDILPYRIIQIKAGVGAGKNAWVTNDLAAKGYNILFITSRKITAEMQAKNMMARTFIDLDRFMRYTIGGVPKKSKNKQFLVSCTNSRLASFILTEYEPDTPKTHLWKFFDFIVVDEAHSLVTDAAFADSVFHVWTFLRHVFECGEPDCRIILMSGTPEPLDELLSTLIPLNDQSRDGSDARVFKFLDLYDTCIHVEPKEISLRWAATPFRSIYEMWGLYQKGLRVIFFANKINDIARYVEELKAYGIKDSEIGVSYSDRDKDALFSKELQDKIDIINDSLVKNEGLPKEIKIFLTTTKNKEGINILDDDIKVMVSESDNPLDLIQMAGRVRKGLDLFVILVNDKIDKHNVMDDWYAFRDTEICPKLNRIVSDYIQKNDAPRKETLIKDIEKTFPYIRFNCFEQEFCIFEGKIHGNVQIQKYKEHFHEAIEYWYADNNANGQDTFRKWFPDAYAELIYDAPYGTIPSHKSQAEEAVTTYLIERNYVGVRITQEQRDNILSDLNEILERKLVSYKKAKNIGPLLKKYGYEISPVGSHKKNMFIIVPLKEKRRE